MAASRPICAGRDASSLTVTATGSYLTIGGPLLLAGVGFGLAVPTTVSASLRAVTPSSPAWPAASAPHPLGRRVSAQRVDHSAIYRDLGSPLPYHLCQPVAIMRG